MKLKINIEGVSESEARRGFDAAMAVFNDAGISPFRAAAGMSGVEAWDDDSFPDEGEFALSDEDSLAADIWLEACEEAVKAACADWPAMPPCHTTTLEIVMNDDEEREIYGEAAFR